MTDYLYEYAVVRFVPRVEREEFINVGLLMMCKRKRWMKFRGHVPTERIKVFYSDVCVEVLKSQLESFRMISEGDRSGGPQALLEAEERFRWLSAVKSSCIQTSRPHCGISENLDTTFEKLFNELVV